MAAKKRDPVGAGGGRRQGGLWVRGRQQKVTAPVTRTDRRLLPRRPLHTPPPGGSPQGAGGPAKPGEVSRRQGNGARGHLVTYLAGNRPGYGLCPPRPLDPLPGSLSARTC